MNKKSFKVAFISDTHIDSYVKPNIPQNKLEMHISNFIDEMIRPEKADILVLGGDIGHYMNQNQIFFQLLAEKKLYKKVFVVSGNHERYIVSNSQFYDYGTSDKKIEHMQTICEEIETVEFLDGNIVEVDGIKISGCCGWFDFSYGYKNFNISKRDMMQKWKDCLNDANYIKGKDIPTELIDSRAALVGDWGRLPTYTFDPIKFFEKEKEKIENVISECDIFVSHVGPIVPKNIRPEYQTPVTGCFYYDGEEFLSTEKAPKLYIFGHTHDKYDFKFNNTTLMCNPLGYKSEGNIGGVVVIDFFDL